MACQRTACAQIDTVNSEVVTYNGQHEVDRDPQGELRRCLHLYPRYLPDRIR